MLEISGSIVVRLESAKKFRFSTFSLSLSLSILSCGLGILEVRPTEDKKGTNDHIMVRIELFL